MRVSLSTSIDLPPETVWAEVQTARLLRHIAWPLVRFIPVADGPFDGFRAGERYQVRLRLFGLLPLGTQWIVTSLHESETAAWPKRLRDNGYGNLIDKWDHWIAVAPDDKGGTTYSDNVDISSGVMTPVVWAFAQVFYRHRQWRWRGLARTLRQRALIADEMAAFSKARAAGNMVDAWRALERAHIISQPFLGLHLANHRAMLGFAVEHANWREAAGQIVRLALAPLGALTGRFPVGNTGRSDVSAFQPMPIDPELLAKMNGASR